MIEDKLYRDERLRLECVAQSVALNGMQRASVEKIISDAKVIEAYIENGGRT